MREVVILIPDVDIEQNIEIDVRINGRKRTIQYRVELLNWEGNDVPPKDKVNVLKHWIADYDKQWELVEIGAPGDENIPLMFRKKIQPLTEKGFNQGFNLLILRNNSMMDGK